MQSRLGQSLIHRIVRLGIVLFIITIGITFVGRIPINDQYATIQQLSTLDQATALIDLSLVNQEAGQRGYDLTGVTSFLAPFREGTIQFQTASRSLDFWVKRYPSIQKLASRTIRAGQYWHQHYGIPQVHQRETGGRVSIEALQAGKSQLDQFRLDAGRLHSLIETLQTRSIHRVRQISESIFLLNTVIFVLAFGTVISMVTIQLNRWIAPLNELAYATKEYAAGRLDTILAPSGSSELQPLFSSIDSMRNAIRLQIQHYGDLARTDPLTQLANRRSLEEYMDRVLSAPDTHPIACLMVDIDRFKRVNDLFGHPSGDLVIQQLSQILLQETRARDMVCRWGGEEFVVILTCTSGESAAILAERIRVHVASRITAPQPITISIGIATHEHEESFDALVHKADRALYLAKDHGRNQVRQYDPSDPTSSTQEP